MANRPSDEHINNFLAIAEGADERTATAFLKGASNNFERAIQDYFDDPGKYLRLNRYDESAWSQDRAGDTSSSQIPAFQIDYATNEQYPHSSAPTRPPSRVSQNSSTKGIPGSPQAGQDDGWQGQEMGVVGSTGTQFGPANREYYDNSAWAMTIAGSSTVELVPDPFPTMRKRTADEPVFLKPLPSDDYLPSLITILHSIPLASFALNAEAKVLGDYHFDSAWWCGSTIKGSQVVDTEDEAPTDHGRDLLQETQRLIAFLDLSQRSYGSVDALAQLKVLEESRMTDRLKNLCDRFLVAWESCANRLIPDVLKERSLFRSEVMTQSPGKPAETTEFCTLQVMLMNQGNGERQTIYDALDELIWSDDQDGSSAADQAILSAGPILCMRVEQPDFASSGLNFQVPSTWYADRYMNEHGPRTKAMRRNVTQQRLFVKQLDENKHHSTTFESPTTGKKMDIQEMLKITKVAFEPPAKIVLEDNDDGDVDVEAVSKKYDLLELQARPDILEKLKGIAENVQQKVERLEQQQQKIKEAIERESSLLKEPSENANALQPKIRYTLCGVATDSRTTYVLKRATEKLIEMNDSEPEQDQWWRLHYSNDPIITKEKVSEDDVLKHASQDSRDVMLVYATDDALRPLDRSINEQLQTFINEDNSTFAAELADAEEAAASRDAAAAAEVAPLTGWDASEDPPAYPIEVPPQFAPDDGKIKDDEQYARQSTLDTARQIKRRNEEARLAATQRSVKVIEAGVLNHQYGQPENSEASLQPDGAMEDVKFGTSANKETVQHVEYAAGTP